MFTLKQDYTRKEIRSQLGGSLQTYLPSFNGQVVCACINRQYNPEAPRVILVGTGKGIERDGAILASQEQTIPVFIKRETNAWTFHGYYRVERSSQESSDIAKHPKGESSAVTRVIYLQPSAPSAPNSVTNAPPASGGAPLRRRREHLLDAILKEHILEAIRLFDSKHPHDFADSTKFDLLHNGHSYPPKAIIGLSGVPLFGRALRPDDFTGGIGSKCFRLLTLHGFEVVPKESEFRPTAEVERLEALTREALSAPSLPKPKGQHEPAQVSRTSTVYERDPLVRAFVLRRSTGTCECCGNAAPFVDGYNEPFLEVHHIKPLAEKGEDVVENAAAICPNCHRECHYGRNSRKLRQRLLDKVNALSNEVTNQTKQQAL